MHGQQNIKVLYTVNRMGFLKGAVNLIFETGTVAVYLSTTADIADDGCTFPYRRNSLCP